jgi:hypothetical protein
LLTYDDAPIIRHAVLKKLDAERGVKVCDVLAHEHPGAIAVGVLAVVDDTLVVRSRFDLPPEWELVQLHNELDEIAEQYKAARMDFWGRGRVLSDPEKVLGGTGLRGRWRT